MYLTCTRGFYQIWPANGRRILNVSEEALGCRSYIAELDGIKQLLILQGNSEIKVAIIEKEIASVRAYNSDYALSFRREEFLLTLSDV